ncbi:hypothetical protein M514_07236, partial [Trichuris suis]
CVCSLEYSVKIELILKYFSVKPCFRNLVYSCIESVFSAPYVDKLGELISSDGFTILLLSVFTYHDDMTKCCDSLVKLLHSILAREKIFLPEAVQTKCAEMCIWLCARTLNKNWLSNLRILLPLFSYKLNFPREEVADTQNKLRAVQIDHMVTYSSVLASYMKFIALEERWPLNFEAEIIRIASLLSEIPRTLPLKKESCNTFMRYPGSSLHFVNVTLAQILVEDELVCFDYGCPLSLGQALQRLVSFGSSSMESAVHIFTPNFHERWARSHLLLPFLRQLAKHVYNACVGTAFALSSATSDVPRDFYEVNNVYCGLSLGLIQPLAVSCAVQYGEYTMAVEFASQLCLKETFLFKGQLQAKRCILFSLMNALSEIGASSSIDGICSVLTDDLKDINSLCKISSCKAAECYEGAAGLCANFISDQVSSGRSISSDSSLLKHCINEMVDCYVSVNDVNAALECLNKICHLSPASNVHRPSIAQYAEIMKLLGSFTEPIYDFDSFDYDPRGYEDYLRLCDCCISLLAGKTDISRRSALQSCVTKLSSDLADKRYLYSAVFKPLELRSDLELRNDLLKLCTLSSPDKVLFLKVALLEIFYYRFGKVNAVLENGIAFITLCFVLLYEYVSRGLDRFPSIRKAILLKLNVFKNSCTGLPRCNTVVFQMATSLSRISVEDYKIKQLTLMYNVFLATGQLEHGHDLCFPDFCTEFSRRARKTGNTNLALRILNYHFNCTDMAEVIDQFITLQRFSIAKLSCGYEYAKALYQYGEKSAAFSLVYRMICQSVEFFELPESLLDQSVMEHSTFMGSAAAICDYEKHMNKLSRSLLLLSRWMTECSGLGDILLADGSPVFEKYLEDELQSMESYVGTMTSDCVVGAMLQLSTRLNPKFVKGHILFAEWLSCYSVNLVCNKDESELFRLSPEDELFVNSCIPADIDIAQRNDVISLVSTVRSEFNNVTVSRADNPVYLYGFVSVKVTADSLRHRLLKIQHFNGIDALIQFWSHRHKLLLRLYEQMFCVFFRVLKLSPEDEFHLVETLLQIIDLLAKHFTDLFPLIQLGLHDINPKYWKNVIPQLFAHLNHPNKSAQGEFTKTLCSLAESMPESVLFPTIVRLHDKSTGFHLEEGRLECCKEVAAVLRNNNPKLVNDTIMFITELHRIMLLREEIWLALISYVDLDASKQLKLLNDFLKSPVLDVSDRPAIGFPNKLKKLRIVKELLFRIILQVYDITTAAPETRNEEEFNATVIPLLAKLISAIKDNSFLNILQLLTMLRQLHRTLSTRSSRQENLSLKIDDISPNLASLKNTEIPIPDVRHGGYPVTLRYVDCKASVLQTKTKPKRLCFVGSNGFRYFYLLKGAEDLNLDQRIMQFINVCNSLFASTPGRKQCGFYYCRSYSVTPLGPRCGLIGLVENCVPAFCVYKKWLTRQESTFEPKNFNERNVSLRPNDIFLAQLFPLLEEENVKDVRNRSKWPARLLKQVLLRLISETPRTLLSKEFWCAHTHADKWWEVQSAFIRSAAVASMVGYVVGLGDRHLDNLLINFDTGEMVNIDYNLCFDRGKHLRVPETVPFRLTQNIECALGIGGVEAAASRQQILPADTKKTVINHSGEPLQENETRVLAKGRNFVPTPKNLPLLDIIASAEGGLGPQGEFQKCCMNLIKMLRCKSATLLKLFDAFIYDPLIDWTAGYLGDGHGTVVQNITYALHPSSIDMHHYKETDFQLKKQLFCLYCRDSLVQWNCYNERLRNAVEAYSDTVMKVTGAESAVEEIEKELQLLRDRNVYLAEAKGDISHPVFTLSQRFAQFRSIEAKSAQLLAHLKGTSQFYDRLMNSYEVSSHQHCNVKHLAVFCQIAISALSPWETFKNNTEEVLAFSPTSIDLAMEFYKTTVQPQKLRMCDSLKNSLLLTYQNLRHLLASATELMPAYIELQRYMPVEFRNSYYLRKWLKLINGAIEMKSTNDAEKLEMECNELLNENPLSVKDASALGQAQKACHAVEAAFSTVSERSAKLSCKDFSNSSLELSLCQIYSASNDFLKMHVMRLVREKLLYVLEKVVDFNEHRAASNFRQFDPDFELKDMVFIMKHVKAAQQFLIVIQSESPSSVVALLQCFERVFNQLLDLIRGLTLEVIPELFSVAAINRGAVVKLLDLLMHFNTSSAITWDSLYDDLVISKIVVCVRNPLYVSTLQSRASCLLQEGLPEGLKPMQPVVKQIFDQYSMLETAILDMISLVTEAEQSDQYKMQNKSGSELFTPIVADSGFFSALFLCRYYATYLAFSGVLACSDFLRGFNLPDSLSDVFIQFPKLVVFTLLKQVLYGLASHVLYVVVTNVEEHSTPSLETEASSGAFKLLEELYRNVLFQWELKHKQRIALTFAKGLSVVHNVSLVFRWCNKEVVPSDRFVRSELLLHLRKVPEMFSRLNWAAGANKVWNSHLESFKHAVVVDKQKIESTMNTCRQLNVYLNAIVSLETLPREADDTLSGNAETVRLVLNYVETSSLLNFEYSKLSQLELKLLNVLPPCMAEAPSGDWLVSLMAKTDQEIEKMNIKRDQSILRFSEAIKSSNAHLNSVRAEFSNFFEHTAETSSVVKNFAKLEENELFGQLHDFLRLCRFHAETAVSIIKSGQMLHNSISM